MAVPTRAAVCLGGFLLACSSGGAPPSAPDTRAASGSRAIPEEEASDPLTRGTRYFESSRYAEAEASFRDAAAGPARSLGLARVYLMTGRYDEVVATLAADSSVEAAALRGEALRRRGLLDRAEQVLSPAAETGSNRARLIYGQVLLEQGRESEAEAVLMRFVEDYNAGQIAETDATRLAEVGRAAQLLGSAHDANDAYNEAEKAGAADADTLLWRAELFLDAYDEGHAEEVLQDLLAKAPNHPEALVWLAQVKLAQNLDFEAAERLCKKALAVNPSLTSAFFVLAGVSLRDLELDAVEARIAEGLAGNPRDLPLLSLRAAARFLADDAAGFEGAKRAVLDKNPRYSEMYRIIGDYADWEHRYEEIVALMREGLLADASDPKLRAQLGINLIRLGQDADGVAALRRAFDDDPFNVRAFNTLNLFEKTIPAEYESGTHGVFTVRYHKQEKPVLERYVPHLLDKAWSTMTAAYGFVPKTPVGIELYPEREHFAIRTSGLPQTYIQGVCFGRTLAAISPMKERFNFGMTLWHELAHVFHIQISNSRVPRWFTEGLAEYETMVQRPEWQREHDLELYDALRLGRLPRVAAMNEAFSHARDMDDMATAYYGSSQIVAFIAERYGRPSLRLMLDLWRAGKRTPEVVQSALGVSAEQLDAAFRAHVKTRLARYERQFVPLGRADDVEVAAERVKQNDKDALARVRLAKALLAVDRAADAEQELRKALALNPKEPEAVWLSLDRALERGRLPEAERDLKLLRELGKDGYAVQMAAARIAQSKKDTKRMRAALEAAHAWDPSQAEPLGALVRLARAEGNKDAETKALRKLAEVDQHDPEVYRSLLETLIEQGKTEEALRIGEAAVYVDLEGFETHALYGRALEAAGKLEDAAFELETAVLCPAKPDRIAEGHRRLASLYERLGQTAKARKHADLAAAPSARVP